MMKEWCCQQQCWLFSGTVAHASVQLRGAAISALGAIPIASLCDKKRAHERPFSCVPPLHPFEARRARVPPFVSSMPLPVVADEPLAPVVPEVAPVPAVELELRDAADPFVDPGPALPGVGSVAPC